MAYRDDLRSAILGVTKQAAGQTVGSPQIIGSQRRHSTLHVDWAGLPEVYSGNLQVVDPESDYFGQFYFMMDYDPFSLEPTTGGNIVVTPITRPTTLTTFAPTVTT